jgi:hypothetical protein
MAKETDKHYNNDWAKSKSRELVRDFAAKTIMKIVDPKYAKVLCFPGQELAEVYQVYDALGIPRENITGIEKYKSIADKITEQKSGINLVNSSLEDFVDSQKDFDFDIVSLDYTSPINNSQMLTISKISNRQTNNHFLLHQANLIKRDSHSLGTYAAGFSEMDFGKDIDLTDPRVDMNCLFEEAAKRYTRFIKVHNSEGSDKELKLAAYTNLVRAGFLGATSEGASKLLKYVCGSKYEWALRQMEESLSQKLNKEIHFDRNNPFENEKGILGARKYLEGLTLSALKDLATRIGIPKAGILIASALQDAIKEKYFYEKDQENYHYISESGAPMVGTIRFLGHPFYSKQRAEEVAASLGWPKDIGFTDGSRVYRAIKEFQKANMKFRSADLIERLAEKNNQYRFLGNSSRPVLSKKRFLQALSEGKDIEEIKREYRGWDNKPLAQWQAHHTRGTYNPKVKDVETQEKAEIKTKPIKNLKATDEIYEYIRAGFPDKEIMEAFGITKKQLGARKAWVTMRASA